MSELPQNFVDLAEQLRDQLNEMLRDIAGEAIKAGVEQIPTIMQREDWSETQKTEALALLQMSLVTPCINLAVNAAQAAHMVLADYLSYSGTAWESVRNANLGKFIQAQLERKAQGGEGAVEDEPLEHATE